jgi:hypothetical protein
MTEPFQFQRFSGDSMQAVKTAVAPPSGVEHTWLKPGVNEIGTFLWS